jgi:glycosyltransferase involved in cell wall biosynthesis
MLTNNSEPLVSIVVITFNSEKYIIETLETAKAQTYKNIELIITDDCSTDNTVDICKQWINVNKSSFVNIRLIEAIENTGIPGNCNRGLSASSGEWVKIIAGDDLLTSNCVQIFLSAVLANPAVKFLVSSMLELVDGVVTRVISPSKKYLKMSPKRQKRLLLIRYHSHVPAPAIFLNRQELLNLGGYDSRYKFMEDFPLEMKISASNMKFHFVNAPTVLHRIHGDSLSGLDPKPVLFISAQKYYQEIVLPEMRRENMFFWLRHYRLRAEIASAVGPRKKMVSLIIRCTDPIYWFEKIYKVCVGKRLTDVCYEISKIGAGGKSSNEQYKCHK